MFEDLEEEAPDVGPESPDRAIVWAIYARDESAGLTPEEAWAILHERYPDDARFLLLNAYAELVESRRLATGNVLTPGYFLKKIEKVHSASADALVAQLRDLLLFGGALVAGAKDDDAALLAGLRGKLGGADAEAKRDERDRAGLRLRRFEREVVKERARSFAIGDFDGNGLSELAFSTVIDGKLAVCILVPTSKEALNDRSCWLDDGAPAGTGRTLVAGDLDEDGKDDLLVITPDGVKALTHFGARYTSAESRFEAKSIEGTEGASTITMLHPGRPGPAQWAIAAGNDLVVFHGTASLQRIDVPEIDPWVVKLGPTIR